MQRAKGNLKAACAILLFLIAAPIFFGALSQGDNNAVLAANPSEISLTLHAGENITENIEIYNNGSENLSGKLGVWGIVYDPIAPTIHISSGYEISIPAGETVTISVEISAAYDPVEFAHWHFTIWFSSGDYFQVLTNISVHTVFPDPSVALQVSQKEIKAVMFQNQWKETTLRIKNLAYEGFNGTLNVTGYVERGSPHVDILLNGNLTNNISFLPKEEKNITLKLYAGDEGHTGRAWKYMLTFRANNSEYVRNLTTIYIYTENIKDKLEVSPKRYDLYLRVGEVGHVYVRVKNNANITVNGSIGGLIPECGCLQTLDVNPENLTLEPGEEKTVDVEITMNDRTGAIFETGACSMFGMDLLLENSSTPWLFSGEELYSDDQYPVPLSTISIYHKEDNSTNFQLIIGAIVLASLILIGAIYYKKRKTRPPSQR